MLNSQTKKLQRSTNALKRKETMTHTNEAKSPSTRKEKKEGEEKKEGKEKAGGVGRERRERREGKEKKEKAADNSTRLGAKANALQTLLEHSKHLAGANGHDPYLLGRRDALMELYGAGGLPQGQMGLQLLFLLPDSFTTFYQALFDRALVGHGESRKSQGVVKAKGNPGTVLGSDNRLQAQGGGKKYRVPAGNIGSEKALQVKNELDKQLIILATDARAALNRNPRSKETNGNKPLQCRGNIEPLPGSGRAGKRCTRFLKHNWNFCPTCGWKIG